VGAGIGIGSPWPGSPVLTLEFANAIPKLDVASPNFKVAVGVNRQFC
jgi:hypothetical protein